MDHSSDRPPVDHPRNLPPEALGELAEKVLQRIEERVFGQRQASEALLASFMAGGHTLLEGVPGIGKTLLAKSFASALGLDFQRLQFTPDLMPSDVVGTNVFQQESGGFHLVRGPIFTQILMADEINRTPPKTQAALLEAMQERQVTIDGTRHPLGDVFFTIATQNPVEFEGTYPLPEAQLDRFLVRIEMSLPAKDGELELYRRSLGGQSVEWGDAPLAAAISPSQAAQLRRAAASVHVAEELLDYLWRLAAATRDNDHLELAISPRGALALLSAARASAVLEGRDFVAPDDLKRFLLPCWQHRLLLTAEAELEGHSAARLLAGIAAAVDVPK